MNNKANIAEFKKIKHKWEEIQSNYDDELLTLLNTSKTDRARLERLDGIIYGIAFSITIEHGLNNGIVSKEFVHKFLNDATSLENTETEG